VGQHRYEAAKSLGWREIAAFVSGADDAHAELWEIDENLIRAELTDSQRAQAHARREEIMVGLGLVATVGANQHSRASANSAKASYADKAAADLGVSRRTVAQDLARGKKIAPEVLAEVSGSALDKGVVLDELAATPRADQRAKLAEITLRRQEAGRVRKDAEAVNRDTDRVIALTEAQRFAEWIATHSDVGQLPTIIAWLEGTKARDVIAALRREAA